MHEAGQRVHSVSVTWFAMCTLEAIVLGLRSLAIALTVVSVAGCGHNSDEILETHQGVQLARNGLANGDSNDFQLRYDLAYAYWDAGAYPKALDEFLWCFEKAPTEATNYSSQIRNSDLILDLKELANVYEPARRELTSRRNSLRRKVLDVATARKANSAETSQLIQDYSVLNSALDDTADTIATFDELSSNVNDSNGALEIFVQQNLELFVENHLYEAISQHLNVVHEANSRIARYRYMIDTLNLDSPTTPNSNASEATDATKNMLVAQLAPYYRVLVATNNTEDAVFIADKLTEWADNSETYYVLAKAGLESNKPQAFNVHQAKNALDMDPSNPRYANLLIDLLRATGYDESASTLGVTYSSTDEEVRTFNTGTNSAPEDP